MPSSSSSPWLRDSSISDARSQARRTELNHILHATRRPVNILLRPRAHLHSPIRYQRESSPTAVKLEQEEGQEGQDEVESEGDCEAAESEGDCEAAESEEDCEDVEGKQKYHGRPGGGPESQERTGKSHHQNRHHPSDRKPQSTPVPPSSDSPAAAMAVATWPPRHPNHLPPKSTIPPLPCLTLRSFSKHGPRAWNSERRRQQEAELVPWLADTDSVTE